MTTCCQKNVFIATEAQERRIRELEAELAELRGEPTCDAVAGAKLKLATKTIGDLLAIATKDGGYRHANAQAKLRGARAVFAELGGKP